MHLDLKESLGTEERFVSGDKAVEFPVLCLSNGDSRQKLTEFSQRSYGVLRGLLALINSNFPSSPLTGIASFLSSTDAAPDPQYSFLFVDFRIGGPHPIKTTSA